MVLDEFPRQLARTRRFTLGVPRAVTISADGGRVLFLRTSGGEDPVSRLWLLDLTAGAGAGEGEGEGGAEQLLADPTASWNAGSGEVPEAERIRRERARELASGIVAYSADEACRTVAFALDGQLWALDFRRQPPVRAPEAGANRRPGDGAAHRPHRAASRVRHRRGAARRRARTPTSDQVLAPARGHAEVTYGLPEHVAAESMHRPRGFWWAPDGRQLLAARVDNSPVLQWWIADPASPQKAPRAIRYPAAGTANAEVTAHVLRLDGTRTELHWDRKAFEYLTAAAWDNHGPLLSVQSRDQRTVLILAADPATGETTVLHEERDPAWVELAYGAPLRTKAGRLVHDSATWTATGAWSSTRPR